MRVARHMGYKVKLVDIYDFRQKRIIKVLFVHFSHSSNRILPGEYHHVLE